ncbi:hypothetical protein NFI95_00615 [Acetobacteraceae bacterium KSS8]|uniref:Uncharacterized protein n=1 Tax=Endosaccharibacter trunci TaxID=2812733 RepID=A0ABT1W270_9PROT|nr:hypothetical protein [Acetobacteraceae bacterium KSS8]
MKNDNKQSFGYRIKDTFLDDQVGTTPNENRIFAIGLLPAALSLTGSITSLYLYIFPEDKRNVAIVPGFVLAVFFGWFAQISMRRALQMRDRDHRIVLLKKLRIIPSVSIGLTLAGLAITLAVWFFPPPNALEKFHILAGLAVVFPVVGILLTPFSFLARRISWLFNPR